MANKTYAVEIDLRAKINILADSELSAHTEAQAVAEYVKQSASAAGLYIEIREVKPRQLITKNETP